MNTVLHLVGTRPQYVKLFPLWKAINEDSSLSQKIYDTGQHYDEYMSANILNEFGFTGVETGKIKGLNPDQQIPKMIENIWKFLCEEAPDYVFIYGDTNSTLAAAIACAKLNISFGHVEAGVRTSVNVGIQEGVNRKVADILATDNFCATEMDYHNLINMGGEKKNTHLVGDLMYDAFHLVESEEAPKNTNLVLVTLHRAENVDDADIRHNIVNSIVELSNHYNIILPLHPRLKKNLTREEEKKLELSNIHLMPPITYTQVVSYLSSAIGVITDSGGLPKDAAFAGVPSIVLRPDPIWHKLSELNYIKTYGEISNLTTSGLIELSKEYFANKLPRYEMGFSVPKIVRILRDRLS